MAKERDRAGIRTESKNSSTGRFFKHSSAGKTSLPVQETTCVKRTTTVLTVPCTVSRGISTRALAMELDNVSGDGPELTAILLLPAHRVRV